MKTKAAVLHEVGKPFEIEELELDGPKEGEILIRYEYAGLCHSDVHLAHGDIPFRAPMVGGHEGAGVVEEVGPAVRGFAPGDHIVCSFIPSCGKCRWCATGRQAICDWGATILEGSLPGPRFVFKGSRGDYGAMCMLGTFSQYSTIHQNSAVKIDPSISLESASIVGCSVPTGWGSAVYAAGVHPGEVVVIFGIGGVGINAVQGARLSGAKYVIAVDPEPRRRQLALELGATHWAENGAQALELVQELTFGVGADKGIVTVGMIHAEVVEEAFNTLSKGATLVIIAAGDMAEQSIQLRGGELVFYRKTVRGSIFGDCNPTYDIPKILGLYQKGDLKLDELITARYSLEEVNQGYDDLLDGRNVRGVIVHDAV
jgi:alcohol dehydrogenase (nicotinoprotein)